MRIMVVQTCGNCHDCHIQKSYSLLVSGFSTTPELLDMDTFMPLFDKP